MPSASHSSPPSVNQLAIPCPFLFDPFLPDPPRPTLPFPTHTYPWAVRSSEPWPMMNSWGQMTPSLPRLFFPALLSSTAHRGRREEAERDGVLVITHTSFISSRIVSEAMARCIGGVVCLLACFRRPVWLSPRLVCCTSPSFTFPRCIPGRAFECSHHVPTVPLLQV